MKTEKSPYEIIRNPLSTEKAVKLMESENKLTFVVDKKASKHEIKNALEKLFNIKVSSVNTLIAHGRKRAYVQLPKEKPAIDVATQLGIV